MKPWIGQFTPAVWRAVTILHDSLILDISFYPTSWFLKGSCDKKQSGQSTLTNSTAQGCVSIAERLFMWLNSSLSTSGQRDEWRGSEIGTALYVRYTDVWNGKRSNCNSLPFTESAAKSHCHCSSDTATVAYFLLEGIGEHVWKMTLSAKWANRFLVSSGQIYLFHGTLDTFQIKFNAIPVVSMLGVFEIKLNISIFEQMS